MHLWVQGERDRQCFKDYNKKYVTKKENAQVHISGPRIIIIVDLGPKTLSRFLIVITTNRLRFNFDFHSNQSRWLVVIYNFYSTAIRAIYTHYTIFVILVI